MGESTDRDGCPATDQSDSKALRESEERFRTLADGCPAIIWVTDAEANNRFVNREYREFFGVTSEEVEGSNWRPLLHPDDAPEYTAAVGGAVRDRAPFKAEARVRRADGEWRWIVSYAEPRFSDGGEFLGHAGISLDITDRRLAEEEWRRSEERYRKLFDTLIEGFCVVEVIFDSAGKPVDYRFLEINPAFEAQTGLKDAKGRLMRELAPAHEAHWFEIYGQIALTGQPARFVNEARALNRWYDVRAWRVGGPESRKVAILFSDITEAKRAADEISRREALLDAFFAAAPGILNILDEEFCYLKTDRITPTYYGLTRDTVVGRRADEFTSDFLQEFGPMMRQVIETGQPQSNVEVHGPIPSRGGEMAWWQATYFPVPLPDGKRGIGIMGFETTELRKAEERLRQAQKLESLGLLAGGVAHDFNNLLVGVIGNASLAREMLAPDHPAVELLDGVLRTGEQAAHLTRQMLAYSGKGKFVVEPLNLSALIPEMIGLVRPSIAKRIVLSLDLEEKLPAIEADRGQVEQVFMNLVLNGAEAIGSREGLLTIRTGVEDVDHGYLQLHPVAAPLAPGKYVYLEVRDTGCGMDEATKARIFDPFFSTKFIGRGLGLAAVDGILRGHKSGITVASAPGKGSCFTVLFPASARAAEASPVVAPDIALHGAGTILVVDDEQIVREMARRALERHGYTVLLADGGLSAIDLFKRHPDEISLVVLDLSMPDMNGEEVLPELRRVRPKVKVVVSSGYSESEALAPFHGQRVSGFIQKPYTSKIIAEIVKTSLSQ